jgi:hypothetical protein
MFRKISVILLVVILAFLWSSEQLGTGLKDLPQTQIIQQFAEAKKLIIDQSLPVNHPELSAAEIDQVERLVLDLINQDRQINGLSELVWDEIAAQAASQHVQEEADNGYISHWGMDGSKPQLRYTRAGGLDAVNENESVSLWLQGGFQGLSVKELENIVKEHQTAMLNEKPPDDGHRKNILDVHHTGVGIAIAVGRYGVAMAQEFTNHYTEMDPVPRKALPGSEINLSGRVLPGYKLSGIYAVWEETPHSMLKEELMITASYSDPPFANLHFFAKPDGENYYITVGSDKIFAQDIKIDREGRFSLAIPMLNRHALDYVAIEIAPKNNLNDRFIAAQFVVEH